MHALPLTEPEIDEFLAAFEGGKLPKEHWTHSAHLFTGACYVHALGEEPAIQHMRVCIKRHNESVGTANTETSGYHETITIAWIKMLKRLLRDSSPMNRAEFAHLAVERFAGDRGIFGRYYEFDLVKSVEARRRWIPPTLASFD